MRRYNSDRKLPPAPPIAPLKAVPPTPSIDDLKAWEDGKLLHDLREASQILTSVLGSGYTYDELRLAILDKQLQERVHYWRRGRRYKLNIRRVIEWQLTS